MGTFERVNSGPVLPWDVFCEFQPFSNDGIEKLKRERIKARNKPTAPGGIRID
jgi:hypothetical protein